MGSMFTADNIALLMTLIIFNVAIIKILQWGMTGINFHDALREKDPKAAQAALEAAPPPGAGESPPDATSYSRVAGFIGVVVMACFLWGLGNYILYKAFRGPVADIQTLLGSIGTFFLAGAALFTPYAFNQLKGVFQSPTR